VSPRRPSALVAALLGVVALTGCTSRSGTEISAVAQMKAGYVVPGPQVPTGTAPIRPPKIEWRRSRAVGKPFGGRLRNGVRLPAGHPDFFTFDLTRGTSPNRSFRRWGTDRLIQTILWAAAKYRDRHPTGSRVGVADLSRPDGGKFGAKYGGLGHASHQNGLDVDILYPRRDGFELSTRSVGQIDRRRAQELVDLFVSAGAQYVFVGHKTGLKGPKAIVRRLGQHDDHMHVRVRPGPSGRFSKR
jgi:murein endopeptidase